MGSCARCLVTSTATARGGNLAFWRQQVRQVTSGSKSMAKKSATTAPATTRIAKMKTSADEASASQKPAAGKLKAVAKKKVGVEPKVIADFAARAKADRATAAAEETPASSMFKMSRIPGSLLAEDLDPKKSRGKVDINSPEFKSASRRWLGLMIGIPFLVVSSWLLWKRRECFPLLHDIPFADFTLPVVLKIQPPGETEEDKSSIIIPAVMWKDMKFVPNAQEPESKGSVEKGQ